MRIHDNDERTIAMMFGWVKISIAACTYTSISKFKGPKDKNTGRVILGTGNFWDGLRLGWQVHKMGGALHRRLA